MILCIKRLSGRDGIDSRLASQDTRDYLLYGLASIIRHSTEHKMINQPPSISIIIPTLDEERFIVNCIDSLISGDYPSSKIEILIIDGGSKDNTKTVVEQAKVGDAKLRVIDNPKKIVPAALNIGIREAKHEIIMWAGAHAKYNRDYVSAIVETLMTEKCASAGGLLLPTADTFLGKSIAIATSSRFGIGNAKYRFAQILQEVDTVFGGCWRKADIQKIGGFNESWVRNQDFELNLRLRNDVGPIVLNPEAKCFYYCRESAWSLAKQYFGYGYWRCRTVLRYRSSFTTRLAAPLFLLGGLGISGVLLIYKHPVGYILPIVYGISLLVVSAYQAVKHRSLLHFPTLPIMFATIHLSWAAGFYWSLFKWQLSHAKQILKKRPNS